jgi:hypothetical protein
MSSTRVISSTEFFVRSKYGEGADVINILSQGEKRVVSEILS